VGRAAPALLAVLAALLAGGLSPAASVGAPEASVGESVPIDDFETPNDWTVTRSPGTIMYSKARSICHDGSWRSKLDSGLIAGRSVFRNRYTIICGTSEASMI